MEPALNDGNTPAAGTTEYWTQGPQWSPPVNDGSRAMATVSSPPKMSPQWSRR